MNLNSLVLLGFVLLLNYPAQSSKIIFLIVIGVLLYTAFMSLLPQLMAATHDLPEMMAATRDLPQMMDTTHDLPQMRLVPKSVALRIRDTAAFIKDTVRDTSLQDNTDVGEIIIHVTPETATNLPALSSAIYSALNGRLLEKSIPEQVILLDKIMNTVSEKSSPAATMNEVAKPIETTKPIETAKQTNTVKLQESIKQDEINVPKAV